MITASIQIEQFKEQVNQEWTDKATIAAWSKWYPQQSVQLHAANDLLLGVAQPQPGMQVLDIAGGTGDPAISVAKAVGSSGHVTVTDLSAGMLAAHEANANKANLTNVSYEQADAHTLKFPDQRFDLVTCRLGVMYFADPDRALKEIYRVLKPSGRAVFIAWGTIERNPFFLTSLSPFMKRVALPQPPAGAPSPFKYGQEGSLAEDLRRAGFKNVTEEGHNVSLPWPGTPENLWGHFYEVAVMFHGVFNSLPPVERQQAIDEVINGYRQYYNGKEVDPSARMLVASGSR